MRAQTKDLVTGTTDTTVLLYINQASAFRLSEVYTVRAAVWAAAGMAPDAVW